MADYGFDGMIKVSFVPTIAVITAPTTTELNAGTPLEAQLTPDGLSVAIATAGVDTSKLNSTANSEIIGRDTYTVSVKYVRGGHSYATAIQAALTRGASGYLVARRDIVATTAWASSQKVEVYPIQCQRPSPDTPAANALQTVMVPMSVTDGGSVRGVDNPATIA